MAKIIRNFRGLKARLPILEESRIAFATDTKETFIGSSDGNIELAKQSDVTALKTKTEKKTIDHLYNMNSLKKYLGTILPKVVFWGDSITAGAGADLWHSNWVSQFSDTLQLTKGSMYGRGYVEPNNAGTSSGWTLENKGINQYRIYSATNTLTAVSSHQKTDRTVDILYSKELDGGSFNVTIDDVVVATASCAGATSFGNKLTISVPKTKTVLIIPTGKTYVEGFIYYGYDGVTSGVGVHKVGHGGFSASVFSDAEINATIKTFTPDLTCIGHIVNDVGVQNLTLYRSKIETAIKAGKASGDVLLYIPSRGKLEVEGGAVREFPFDDYKKILYDLADQYDCAVMDFDKFIGGYTKAKINDLLVDDVHPNQKGHDLMAKIAISALIPNAVPSQYGISHAGNLGDYYDMLIKFPSILGRLRFIDDLIFGGIVKGYSEASAGESYLRTNKMKVVNDGTFDFVAIENYGASGSIMTLKDKAQPNIFVVRNSSNISYILSGKTIEIDTTDADKFANPTKVKNLLVADSGIKIGAPLVTNVQNNTFFMDAGVLKFKDNTGVIKTVTLT